MHFIFLVDGIQCYQCSSEEDEFCPAFGKFDETKNALVDCFSLESYVPGHMCMKMVKESYDTFYAKGFKTVIRSCASRSTLGVAQGCRYFVDEVGLEVAVCVSYFNYEKKDRMFSSLLNT
ncbi:unnamed protein product [Rotaria sp. Silwood1]|nr:unnamed protein product [Rotaria sp. Silwood1]CAF4727508.1 unnamed protein product [Rotaria sp. Silwood1]CAF4896538.1 unnamed protein product [Rotaria sp. Silwood1]